MESPLPPLMEMPSLYHMPLQGPMRTHQWWPIEWLDGGGLSHDLNFFFPTLKIMFVTCKGQTPSHPPSSALGFLTGNAGCRNFWWADMDMCNHTSFWSTGDLPFSGKDPAQKLQLWGFSPDSLFTPYA